MSGVEFSQESSTFDASGLLIDTTRRANTTAYSMAHIDQIAIPQDFFERARYMELQAQAISLHDLLENPTAQKVESMAAETATQIWQSALKDAAKQGLSPEKTLASAMIMAGQEASTVEMFRQHAKPDSPTTTSRAFSEHLLWNVPFHAANHFYSVRGRKDILNFVSGFADLMQKHGTANTDWLATKFSILSANIPIAFSILDIFMDQESTGTENAGELAQAGDELWQAARMLRRFGLKPANAPTSLPGITNINMRPGFELETMLKEHNVQARMISGLPADPEPTKFTLSGAVATVVLTNLPLRRESPKIQTLGSSDKGYIGMIGPDQYVDMDNGDKDRLGSGNHLVPLQLRPDGNLYTLAGVPLQRWSEALSCEEAYQQVRLECLSLYFDLVVPVYIQKMAKDHVNRFRAGLPIGRRIYEMVIARRKILYEKEGEIVTRLKQDEAELKEKVKAGLSTKRRAVTGHIRDLPPEYSASLEARELALSEFGKVLADYGETWVRYHERGSTGEAEVPIVNPIRGVYKNRQKARRQKRAKSSP